MVDANGEKIDPAMANAATAGGGALPSAGAGGPPPGGDGATESMERPVNKADIGERCKIKG